MGYGVLRRNSSAAIKRNFFFNKMDSNRKATFAANAAAAQLIQEQFMNNVAASVAVVNEVDRSNEVRRGRYLIDGTIPKVEESV